MLDYDSEVLSDAGRLVWSIIISPITGGISD